MFDIVGDTLGVSMAPVRVDRIAVCDTPVIEGIRSDGESSFFVDFACACLCQRFVERGSAAGDGLPEAGVVDTLEQQYIERL